MEIRRIYRNYSGSFGGTAKIEKGEPIEYHDSTIKDNLRINNWDVPAKHSCRDQFYKEYFDLRDGFNVLRLSIKFDNCTFEGFIDFDNTIFEDDVIFTKCKFNKYAHFKGCEFRKLLNFERSHFKKFADFSYSEFIAAHFIGCTFDLGAHFMISQFNGAALFNGSQCKQDISFFRSVFGNFSQFNGSKFDDTDLGESKFGIVFFDNVKFEGTVNSSNSIFSDFVSFKGSIFSKSVDFSKTRFGDAIDLSKTRFDNAADFRGSFFNGDLSLNYSNFTIFELPWSLIKGKLSYDIPTYLALIKNYNNLGWFDDADNCYYYYKIKRARELKVLNRIMDGISWIAYGYGVRPEFPLITLLVIFFVFSIFYRLENAADFPEMFKLSAIILTTTTETGDLIGDCKWLCIIERIAGWLLMASFLVVFARKTIR